MSIRNKINAAIVSCLSIGLCLCSTTRISPNSAKLAIDNQFKFDERKSMDQATLMVNRDSGFFGSACTDSIFLNKELVGKIGVSEKIVLYLEPGEYILGSKADGICPGPLLEIEILLKQKETKYYRISRDAVNGSRSIQRTNPD